MSTAQLSPDPVLRFFDNNGNPLAGGLLYTYIAGTSTPQASYPNSNESVPNTNPVVLNFRGECSLWIDPTLSYKFNLTDSLGNTIPGYPVDNIQGFEVLLNSNLTQQMVGDALYPQTVAELNASVTPTNFAYPPYNILRYGADPSGTATSDVAMSSAIAVCGTTGGTIVLPNGKYTFASQIALNQKVAPIILQGVGGVSGGSPSGTVISYIGTTSPWMNWNSSVGIELRDIYLINSNTSFTGTFIKCSNDGVNGDPAWCAVRRCLFANIAGGTGNLHIDLDKSQQFRVEGCNFSNGNPAISGKIGATYSNCIHVTDNQFVNCYVAPIQNGGEAWTISGNVFEALVTTGNPPGALLSTTSAGTFIGVIFQGNWLGDAGVGVGSWIDIYGQGITISGNYFSGDTTGSTAIVLRVANGVNIEDNSFNSFLNGINFGTAPCNDIVVKANVANSVSNPWVNGNNAGIAGLDFGVNFGFGVPGTNHGLLAVTGYHINADGTIDQWGLATSQSHGNNTVTFPLQFPHNCYNVVCTLSAVAATTATIYAGTLSTASFVATIADGTSTTDSFYWRAIGN